MQKLPLKQYAALLCEIIGKYDFPAITYNFAKNEEIRHCSMLAVEHYIGGLLHSECLEDVKNGLSNVLYWGWAQKPGLRDFRVGDFRSWACNLKKTDSDKLKGKLDRFKQLAKELGGSSSNDQGPSGGSGLAKIEELELRQFSKMSFVSKILMFLDPARYPVLDREIANAYANSFFAPLKDLKKDNTSIPITGKNKNPDVYDEWACWCREIAKVVNESPESPCNHFRAVDVERALFTLAQRGVTYDARLLLAGPVD